ncbi:MAG: peptidylprolyl isomerase [Thermoanaerobaculales bacterium]|nr:peptidylprolyl isomerase [Thermoanaerobaculales bacterium]
MPRGFLRHPGFRIVLLGALVAAAIMVVRGAPTGADEKRVIVTGADLLQLKAGFSRTWQREPTATELRGLVDQHIRQEVLYREALARGYDRDDPIVRQTMRQKMEFLAAAQAGQGPPSDGEIEAFFTLRRERYRLPAVLSLAQVYIDPGRGTAPAEDRAAALLKELEGADPDRHELAALGDRIMLQPVYERVTTTELASIFGERFAEAVVDLSPDAWSGPIRSGYGVHLVRLTELEPSRVPSWTEVRSQVARDIKYEAATAAKEQVYQEIAQSYRVVTDAEVAALLESAAE